MEKNPSFIRFSFHFMFISLAAHMWHEWVWVCVCAVFAFIKANGHIRTTCLNDTIVPHKPLLAVAVGEAGDTEKRQSEYMGKSFQVWRIPKWYFSKSSWECLFDELMRKPATFGWKNLSISIKIHLHPYEHVVVTLRLNCHPPWYTILYYLLRSQCVSLFLFIAFFSFFPFTRSESINSAQTHAYTIRAMRVLRYTRSMPDKW